MNTLIEDYLDWMEASGMSAATIESRRQMLTYADHLLPCGLEAAVHEELVGFLAAGRWKQSTRCTYHHNIKAFYAWATDPRAPQLDYNPAARLRAPRAPRTVNRNVSPEVMTDIFARATQPWWLFALLAAASGLRCCEIAGLHREDITEETLTIRRAKGGDQQSMPTHPAVWSAVRDFPPGSLAVSAGGKPNARWVSIRSAVYFRRKLILPGVSLHRLRHSYGTELRRAGHDLFVIQKLMRHESISSTQIYVEVGEGERRRAVHTLPDPTTGPAQAA